MDPVKSGMTGEADDPKKEGRDGPVEAKPVVRPSPWQPPAEVDPVLPPVEGDEPQTPDQRR